MFIYPIFDILQNMDLEKINQIRKLKSRTTRKEINETNKNRSKSSKQKSLDKKNKSKSVKPSTPKIVCKEEFLSKGFAKTE